MVMLFKITDLEYSYGDQCILKKQNINFKEGHHLLISGPSGCGKTTLMNLMAGLLVPDSGNIFFREKNLCLMSEKQLDELRAKNFGFIFQKLHLISHLNIDQNIEIGCPNREQNNLFNIINDLGLSEKRKQKVRDLSLGEAQRVAIARSLIKNPKVIFADEPTSSLDDLNTSKVMDLLFLQAKKNNTSLVVSSHDFRIKKFFTNVIEL